MKIVLLKEVQGLGRAGDIKEISEGYARNFLIPRGLADIVGKQNVKLLQEKKNKQEKTVMKEQKEKIKTAKAINNKTFEIKSSSDDKGSLYAKIGAKSLAEELGKQGLKISEKDVKIDEPIKKIGRHEISLELAGENVKIFVEVKEENK